MIDILIKNGVVYDPETELCKHMNVGLNKGKIAVITTEDLEANEIIDASDLYIVPGFIDIHIHEDPMIGKIINFSTERAMLRMGVTTAVGGNCGFSPNNMNEYIEYISKNGAPINTMLLQGYNVIRGRFFSDTEGQSTYRQGDVFAAITNQQIELAKNNIKESMEAGAAGLSFGLEYTPGCELEEMVKVCDVLKQYKNALIAVHYRYDADRCLESINECIELSRRTGVALEFSHIGSCSGYGDLKYMENSLELLKQARSEGVDITSDCYPYTAFSTLIGSTVFDDGCLEKWNVGYDAILPTQGRYKNQYCTKEIFDYLRNEEPDTRVVCFAMKEENVFLAYKDENMIVASDGKFINDQGHARTAGTFPRVIGLVSREKGVLTFKEAIKKMTLLPANRMHLSNKGRLQEGMDADITIINRDTVIDANTFISPAERPKGIEYVIVDGNIALKNGEIVAENKGQFIKRQG
ncbi:MAG: amidohydrolase family protein [Peptostreptococcaceae bacterium]|nr:amidohydrolase family protein [Peptostreptococcaceae bacterium]